MLGGQTHCKTTPSVKVLIGELHQISYFMKNLIRLSCEKISFRIVHKERQNGLDMS